MTLMEAIKTLEEHNKWRRGDETVEMCSPAKLGIAIEMVCKAACDNIQGVYSDFEWQPIETAPNDSWILVACGDITIEASWHPNMECFTDISDAPVFPTHWMPLPSPPSTKPEEKE